MILKGSQRGGAGQLAAHLLNMIDNDHIELQDVRGFAADDLAGALDEAQAVAKGTNCKQFLFSLSLNPPKDAEVGIEAFKDAAERAGKALGLDGQPMVLIVHEKEGRRHAHAVWSRIDADDMKAINLPFFKNRLKDLSKELYLDHGWTLPDGHKENGWANPLNFTLAEWQQAKRLALDPREIKQLFQESWLQSDSAQSFKAALEDRGFFLSKGDRRGFVALDVHGEVYSVSRMTGAKPKELEQRLGTPDKLMSVDDTRLDLRQRIDRKVHQFLRDARQEFREQQRPLLEEHAAMIAAQRAERELLTRGQEERRIRENRERQSRIRTGIRGLLDFVIGRAAAIRRINEREALECVIRDRGQCEGLFRSQIAERQGLQRHIDRVRKEQRQTLMQMGRAIGRSLKGPERVPAQTPKRDGPRPRGPDLSDEFNFGL